MLYIVPTPIGNLGDVTLRAITVLKEVDRILAEDTRTSGVLLKHHSIGTPTGSFHAHNEHRILDSIITDLKNGKHLALISDAGTPGISDPGFLLVRACIENGIEVTCLPGSTAFVPALVMSGFPSDRFHYEGFLPQKKGRQKRWEYLKTLQNTIVLYESPHRIIKCVKEIIDHFGPDHPICICRELTKIHEEAIRGTAEEVLINFEGRDKIRGEIVVVISA